MRVHGLTHILRRFTRTVLCNFIHTLFVNIIFAISALKPLFKQSLEELFAVVAHGWSSVRVYLESMWNLYASCYFPFNPRWTTPKRRGPAPAFPIVGGWSQLQFVKGSNEMSTIWIIEHIAMKLLILWVILVAMCNLWMTIIIHHSLFICYKNLVTMFGFIEPLLNQ